MLPEDKLIISRAEDALELADRQYIMKSVGFLDPHQRNIINMNVRRGAGLISEFFGGYNDAERTMFFCYPEYIEPDYSEAISVLVIEGREISGLTHRDYLGSALGLGIKRENIGDILVYDDHALMFVKADIAGYIMLNLTKIGRKGVKIREVSLGEVEIPDKEYSVIKRTVSGLRLDSVIAASINVSRSKAVGFIKGSDVKLNWEICENVSHSVKPGDVFSVRGYGRFKFESAGELTRKNRINIVVHKYV